MLRAAGLLLAGAALGVGAGELATRWANPHAPPPAASAPSPPLGPAGAGETPAPSPPPGRCAVAPAFAAAAAQNAQSLQTAPWSVFHRPELGWEIYAPLIGREIGADCDPRSEGFAAALASWQQGHRLAPTGAMDEATLRALALVWEERRPFVAASEHGACPAPPTVLATAAPDESYGRPAQLRPAALEAYRRMVAAARSQEPALAADRRLLTIFSGYRDPAADAARCLADENCDTVVRANCSAHRTGLAMDLFLGAAPGYRPDSSADANRLYLSRSSAYLWLVAHAADYGFVNYPFEPWHWEWTGEAP
jgi:D-alanyl-D-alanine carboxypeptidase